MARPLPPVCLLAGLLGLFAAGSAPANPPAPSFTIHGSVRAETGRPLDTGEGIVILSTPAGVEVTRGPVDTTLGRGINYRLEVPMDAGTTTDLYKATAHVPEQPFKIQVLVGSRTYVPIAVAGRLLDTNRPGDRERFDFVLGLDGDGDGLPDLWEQGLIDASATDGLLGLGDIDAKGDADGDGIGNYQEFLAGTYGVDASDGVYLDVLGVANGQAQLGFRAGRGRTYSIRSSIDLKAWVPRSISLLPNGAEPQAYYRAADGVDVRVYVPVDPVNPATFYKLDVE